MLLEAVFPTIEIFSNNIVTMRYTNITVFVRMPVSNLEGIIQVYIFEIKSLTLRFRCLVNS